MDNSFCEPPPKEMLMEMAKEKNCQALPALKKSAGLTLPPDRFALLLPNYRLRGGNLREPGVGL
uniref:Uncharacterized protein n=2 Tax=Romanomermis culicivorax TaxID=13658 RepID=A0A915IH75_ROMCU